MQFTADAGTFFGHAYGVWIRLGETGLEQVIGGMTIIAGGLVRAQRGIAEQLLAFLHQLYAGGTGKQSRTGGTLDQTGVDAIGGHATAGILVLHLAGIVHFHAALHATLHTALHATRIIMLHPAGIMHLHATRIFVLHAAGVLHLHATGILMFHTTGVLHLHTARVLVLHGAGIGLGHLHHWQGLSGPGVTQQ